MNFILITFHIVQHNLRNVQKTITYNFEILIILKRINMLFVGNDCWLLQYYIGDLLSYPIRPTKTFSKPVLLICNIITLLMGRGTAGTCVRIIIIT